MAARTGATASPSALLRSAELERAAGDFEQAAVHYKKYLSFAPGDEVAQFLLKLMRGSPHHDSLPTHRFHPAPFIILRDVLSPTELAKLWELVADSSTRFKPSMTYLGNSPGSVDPARRMSLVMRAPKEVQELLVPKAASAIRELDAVKRFATRPVILEDAETEVASSTDGGHFGPHANSGPQFPDRTITFVYYFFRTPQRFGGGDLLIHDMPPERGPFTIGYTRYRPQCNSMVLFPSNRLHEVLSVTCESSDPLDGRLTVHGWFASA